MHRRHAKKNVPIELLRAVTAVVDTGSFTKAADALDLTQSAISAQIARLAQLLGGDIFAKGPGITLTKRGLLVLQYARRMLAINDELLACTGPVSAPRQLVIGLPTWFGQQHLVAIFEKCSGSPTGEQVSFRCDRSEQLDARTPSWIARSGLPLQYGGGAARGCGAMVGKNGLGEIAEARAVPGCAASFGRLARQQRRSAGAGCVAERRSEIRHHIFGSGFLVTLRSRRSRHWRAVGPRTPARSGIGNRLRRIAGAAGNKKRHLCARRSRSAPHRPTSGTIGARAGAAASRASESEACGCSPQPYSVSLQMTSRWLKFLQVKIDRPSKR